MPEQRIEAITSAILFTRIGHEQQLKTILEWEISKDIRFYNDPDEEWNNNGYNDNLMIEHILDGWIGGI